MGADQTKLATGSDEAASSLYEQDFYAWAMSQAAALRERRFADLDMPNLIDEVGGLARQETDRLQEKLERLTHQLLLWDFRATTRSLGRVRTIRNQRRRVARDLGRNPSLSVRRDEILRRAYIYGRFAALREADDLPSSALPKENPYSWHAAMEREIAAEDAARAAE